MLYIRIKHVQRACNHHFHNTTVAKTLHNVPRSPEEPFSLVRRDALTRPNNRHQWHVVGVAAEVGFDSGKCLFNWIIVRRVGREIDEFTDYKNVSETLQVCWGNLR